MMNHNYKSALGNYLGIYLRRRDKENSMKFYNTMQLETAKMIYEYEEPKPYQFWKKKVDVDQEILKNTFERLEQQKLLHNHT